MTKPEEKEKTGLSDMIKKVVSVGVGAGFMSEEAIKGILQDLPLPKDMLNGLVQNAKGAKEEFTQSIREEIRHYLSTVDASKLVEDILDKYDVEVEAKFKFKRKTQTKKNSPE